MPTTAQYNTKWGRPNVGNSLQVDKTWYAANIVKLALPWDMVLYTTDGPAVHTITVHRLAAPHFLTAFNAVWTAAQANCKLHPGLTTRQNLHSFGGDVFSGAWNLRYTRGYEAQGILSPHSWGIAIDIDASENPMGNPLRTTFPAWYVNAWKSAGFLWGGEFEGRKDSMHFQVSF